MFGVIVPWTPPLGVAARPHPSHMYAWMVSICCPAAGDDVGISLLQDMALQEEPMRTNISCKHGGNACKGILFKTC